MGLVEGGPVFLLGPEGEDALGGSAWAKRRGHSGGVLPGLDYDVHSAVLRVVRELVADDLVAGLHDISDGGLAVALAEMAAAGGIGCRVAGIQSHGQLFSEAPSRVLVCIRPENAQDVLARCAEGSVQASLLGASGGTRLIVEGLVDLDVAEVQQSWRRAIPDALAGGPAA